MGHSFIVIAQLTRLMTTAMIHNPRFKRPLNGRAISIANAADVTLRSCWATAIGRKDLSSLGRLKNAIVHGKTSMAMKEPIGAAMGL